MSSFSPKIIEKLRFHPATTWLLSQCAEGRGMQEMWKRVRPEILKALKESAVIQSAESSNRIEGVEVARDRLVPLVLGETRPRDRSEEEVVGYRKALNYIHTHHSSLEVSAKTVLKLHSLAQGGMTGDAGKWKVRDNEIIEFSSRGERTIRFKPVSAKDTPRAIEQLCLGYRDVIQQQKIPDLVAVASFVLDFLCIHPFRDGNGRVSRLLTLLLLYQNNYEVGRYLSLERIVESTKEDYYRVLKASSTGWHSGEHDSMPWWNYFLGVLRDAYSELKQLVEQSQGNDTKSTLIRQTIGSLEGLFSVQDVCRLLPGIDRELVKKVIYAMHSDGSLAPTGKGRGAKWQRR